MALNQASAKRRLAIELMIAERETEHEPEFDPELADRRRIFEALLAEAGIK